MRKPFALTLCLSTLGLTACQLDLGRKDGQEALASPCPAGQEHLIDSSRRDLCVALEAVAEPPFQTGFRTARVVHRITLTDADGNPIDVTRDPLITDVSHHPLMHMNSGHDHSAPHAHEPEDSSDPARGIYDLVAYYVMASGPMMGDWVYEVLLEDAGSAEPLQAVFHPQVQPTEGDDLFFAKLSNGQDRWQGMDGTVGARPYRVWLHAVDGQRLTVFVSTRDMVTMQMNGKSMMHLDFPEVAVGTELHDENGTAFTLGTVSVRASLDGQNWVTLDDDGEGRYSGDLPGLSSGARAAVQIELTVNGLAMKTAADEDGLLSFTAP